MKIEDIYSELPILETDRIKLRKMTINDVNDMYEYCSDEEISKYTVWFSHKSVEDTHQFLRTVLSKYEKQEVSPWGIEDKKTKKFIGTTGFISWDTKNSKAELGYAVSRKFWNQGYMTEAVKRVISFGFKNMDLVRIEARCHPHNIGSARVMEKTGMKFEGILRKHILAKGIHEDVMMYSIIKDDFES